MLKLARRPWDLEEEDMYSPVGVYHLCRSGVYKEVTTAAATGSPFLEMPYSRVFFFLIHCI